MKKWICLAFIAALLLSICGCTGSGDDTAQSTELISPPDGTFRVGYARTDITPERSVPLAGFGNTSMRMSTDIQRRLYATSVAMQDPEGNTVVLIAWDIITLAGNFAKIVSSVSEATGLPADHIVVSCSHTHAGPDPSSSEPSLLEYVEQIAIPMACEAAKLSLQDLKTAELTAGSVETENLNFVKHYQNTDEEGNVYYFGDNFGTAVYDDTTQHTSEIDETMHVLKIAREGEKDIIMTNWRAHPLLDGSASTYSVSSDFIGSFRQAMELQMACEFVYFQGAAGNNNSTTRLDKERRTTDTAEYGALLAGYVMDCLENNMKPVQTGLIQTRQTMLESRINHTTDEIYHNAKAVQAVWTATNNYQEAVAAGGNSGIRSPYQANAIVSRQAKPDVVPSELNAIVIGDLAFISAPNELFDVLSVMVEEGSPYEFTWCLGFANAYTGYIPSAYGWQYTSYESDVSWFEPGTGEIMVECFLSMLQDIKDQR